MDRAISTGGAGGPVATDVKSILYGEKKKPRVLNVIAGLGGRDLMVSDFVAMFEMAKKKKDETFEIYGVRE
jgi:pyruvate ferredoxin oxidoreductase alpha subunit